MRHNFLAQFLLIVCLALSASSTFAEEVSDFGRSSQNMSKAEESISEELKSVYQDEVDQVLAEGVSYTEEERLSDFPDLDSLLSDEVVPTRVAEISKDQKEEKGRSSISKLGIQNSNIDSEIFPEFSDLSQNCALGLNVLLPDLKLGRIGLEFLPRIQAKDRTGGNKGPQIEVYSFDTSLSNRLCIVSLSSSGEGSAFKSSCLIENQRNLHLGSGVPTTKGWYLEKTLENALESGFGLGTRQIRDISRLSGESYENWTFSQTSKQQGLEIGKSALVYFGERKVAVKFSGENVDTWFLSQALQLSLRKVLPKVGQDSYKFSSGRPTLEILT